MPTQARAIIENYCTNARLQLDNLLGLIDVVSTRQQPDNAAILEAIGEAHRMGGAAHCMGFAHFGAALLDLGQELTAALENDEVEPIEAVWRAQHLCGLAVRQFRYVSADNSSLLRKPEEGDGYASEAPPVGGLQSRYGDARILFAEDDASVRDLVGHILEEEGFDQVRFARSGSEALEIAETFHPTLILTDWSMKEMGGLELLRSIRGGSSTIAAEAPVIVITTQNNLGKVRAVVREGANHFLLKPFTRDVLVGAIEKVLHRAEANAERDLEPVRVSSRL